MYLSQIIKLRTVIDVRYFDPVTLINLYQKLSVVSWIN